MTEPTPAAQWMHNAAALIVAAFPGISIGSANLQRIADLIARSASAGSGEDAAWSARARELMTRARPILSNFCDGDANRKLYDDFCDALSRPPRPVPAMTQHADERERG